MTPFNALESLVCGTEAPTVYDKLSQLKGLPFYCLWDDKGWSYDPPLCCYNHAIGMPRRLNKTMPLFTYQKEWFEALQSNKMVYILKCTSAGATEFMIRYLSWLCLKDDKLKGSQMVIATGPRIETSIAIIERMKHLFIDSELLTSFNTKQTVIELNGIRTIAIPSDHLDSGRGIPNVSVFYSDETAFYSNKEQENLRDVSERYIAKSHPQIIYISTPNRPSDIMERISLENDSMYHRIYTDYSICLRDGMFTEQEIFVQKRSPSFEREYNLKFLGSTGNTFHYQDIDASIEEYSLEPSLYSYAPTYLSCDVGFSSSETAIVITGWVDGKVKVLFAESYERPLFTFIVQKIRELNNIYKCVKNYIDGSAVGLIAEVKNGYNENLHWNLMKPEEIDVWITSKDPLVVPFNFRTHGKPSMQKLQHIIENRRISIHPQHNKLIISLRTAQLKDTYDLDKVHGSEYTDLLDCLRMCAYPLRFKGMTL